MPSSPARSTRGQENEAWAQYKKNPSRETRATFLGTDTSFAQSHPPLLEKIPDRRQLFFLAKAKPAHAPKFKCRCRWSIKDNNN